MTHKPGSTADRLTDGRTQAASPDQGSLELPGADIKLPLTGQEQGMLAAGPSVGPAVHAPHEEGFIPFLGPERLHFVVRRIHEKMDDYESYNFTHLQSYALNIFFDLAQELTEVEEFYAICVMIPKNLFNVDCNLFVKDSKEGLVCRCSAVCPVLMGEDGQCRGAARHEFVHTPSIRGDSYLIPIKANRELISLLPFPMENDTIGMLEIKPVSALSGHDRFFFERYANRVGFQLHNRIIATKNREHLSFIRSLVKDIGHNVIVPNMYFKLFYRRLEARIKMLAEVNAKITGLMQTCENDAEDFHRTWDKLRKEMAYVGDGLAEQYKEIFRHYENTSLFLETLLRRSHFEEGRYVLERRKCNFKSQVIDPQVERYRPRLEERGVEIDTSLGGVPDQEIEVVVDLGLVSQVYSNLFSNAVKYTREVFDSGRMRKFMSYGWKTEKDYFGPGRDGIKLNVFSSGPAIAPDDAARLFSEGFRAGNASGEYGSGHGLHFIKEVVRLHGGRAGYEPTPLGNNFFFVLPVDPESAVPGAYGQT